MTETQVLRRPVAHVQATRVHDFLYDKLYTLSSERDHARANFRSQATQYRIRKEPIFRSMFSELRNYPAYNYRMDTTDPVPRFVNRQWPGYANKDREAAIRYATFNYDPHCYVPPAEYEKAEVSGRDRFRYFRRPIIPFLQQVPPEVLLATARQDPLRGPRQIMIERPPTPPIKQAQTQTDYRDSEAQTDPYTPEYVVRPGSAPELLTLATLSHGRGLPAGLAEVEMIERARAKRAWELSLPSLNDMTQLDKRKRMMDEMERREWALREREIEKLQEARLEVLKVLLIRREENHQDLNIKRMDKLWHGKQKAKENYIKKIRNEHIRALRKLNAERRRKEDKRERRNIINEYVDPASHTYAPLTRIGWYLDRGSEQYVVKSRYLSTYQGLCELEASLPDFVTNPRIVAPQPVALTKSGYAKRGLRQALELAEMYEAIQLEKHRLKDTSKKPLRFLQKVEKPIPRPPTPSVEHPDENEEEKELAVIFLQEMIRGRGVQNLMFEGKEKRIELIRELRSTHALMEHEQQDKMKELEDTLALQRQRRLHEHKESLVDEALSHLEGDSLGDTMDFLSKELVRLQEERRIHAFSMLAERERRLREAEESGKRQQEERRRREQDEIFKQTMKVHQDTVDTYLEDVILGAVDRTADAQAREEIHQQAQVINDLAYDIEDRRTQLESEEIVADLVHCFLIPEVRKATVREKIRRQQRKYLLAAHTEIHRETQDILTNPHRESPAPTSQSASKAKQGKTTSFSSAQASVASSFVITGLEEETRPMSQVGVGEDGSAAEVASEREVAARSDAEEKTSGVYESVLSRRDTEEDAGVSKDGEEMPREQEEVAQSDQQEAAPSEQEEVAQSEQQEAAPTEQEEGVTPREPEAAPMEQVEVSMTEPEEGTAPREQEEVTAATDDDNATVPTDTEERE